MISGLFFFSTVQAQELVQVSTRTPVDSLSFRTPTGSDNATPESEAEAAEAAEAAPPLANLKLSGQIRHRSEINARYATPDTDDPRFHLLRTRLNISFEPAEDVTALIQIQDSRVFGGEDPTLGRGTLDGNADALDFHQAFFIVDRLFDTAINLKLGRQEMAYGTQNFIGLAGWSNVGRTFDAAVASYSDTHRDIDIFTAKLVSNTDQAASQNLHGMYSSFHYLWTHHIDVFAFLDNNTETLERGEDAGEHKLSRYTFGGVFHGQEGLFDYTIEGALQRGKSAKTDSTARANIEAFAISASTGFVVHKPSKSRVGLGMKVYSGDDTPYDKTSNVFVSLFGSGHAGFGYMDYFPGTYYGHGHQDYAIKLASNIGKRLKTKADMHYFRLGKAATLDETQQTSLGYELDLTFSYKYNQNLTIGTGYSRFFADDLMQQIIGDSVSDWFYITTQVQF